MKRLLLISVLFIITFNIRATHYMGGEITWECIPAGQADAGKFIFTLKVYRECYTNNGGSAANFGSTATITSNSPTGSFNLTRLPGYPIDISPVCNSYSGFTHITCVGDTSGAANMGAVQLHIYKSQPIQLNGIPPSTGWRFGWSSCCRNPASNVSGQPAWYLRAIMYPFNNQNTFPCFDNSPEFAENPKTVISAGYPFSYSNLAHDVDLDSLHFDWGQPMSSANAYLTYAFGYTYQNPLPGITQDSNNIAATLDPITGEVNLTSFTTGAYVSSYRVGAYRCGTLISETWRDIQVVISALNINTPPIIHKPFAFGTSFDTTIYAGDSIEFDLGIFENQLLPNGSPQTIDLGYFGQQFGDYIPSTSSSQATLNTTSGCLTPPCAIITPAPGSNNPITAIDSIQTKFKWQTTCDHINQSLGCNNGSNTFRFLFFTKDDYCPVPASNAKVVSITLISKPKLNPPVIDTIKYSYDSNWVHLSWLPVLDTINSFVAYDIYYSNSYSVNYVLLDSIMDINQTSYSYYTGEINTAYYYIRTKGVLCNNQYHSAKSSVLGLNLTSLIVDYNPNKFILYQNQPNPTNGITNIPYYINKEIKGQFLLYDISGRIVLQKDLFANQGRNNFDIETSTLPEGIYYYRLEFGDVWGVRKLIVLR